MYSPAAMENAPARRPAIPVSSNAVCDSDAPVTPRIKLMFDTSPSLNPNTPARRTPFLPRRAWRAPTSSSVRGIGCPVAESLPP
jgi:hypothetical protein